MNELPAVRVGHADVDGLTVARDGGALTPSIVGRVTSAWSIESTDPATSVSLSSTCSLLGAARPHGQLVGLGLRRLVQAGLVDEVLVLLLLVVVGAGRRHQGVPVVDLGGLVVEVPDAAVVEVVEHDEAAVDPEGHAVAGLLGALGRQRGGGLVAGAAAVGAVEHPAGLGPRGVQAAAEHDGPGDQRAAGDPVDALLHGDPARGDAAVERHRAPPAPGPRPRRCRRRRPAAAGRRSGGRPGWSPGRRSRRGSMRCRRGPGRRRTPPRWCRRR